MVRFRDDIFAVVDGDVSPAERFAVCITALASLSWKISLDCIHQYGVPMLDLLIYKGPRHRCSGLWDFRPYTKPTALHVPLSPASCHHRSAHIGWPIGEIRWVFVCSLRLQAFRYDGMNKFRRWRHLFVSPQSLAVCTDLCARGRPPQKKGRKVVADVLRVVLPFIRPLPAFKLG